MKYNVVIRFAGDLSGNVRQWPSISATSRADAVKHCLGLLVPHELELVEHIWVTRP